MTQPEPLIGREDELLHVRACLRARRNVLLEGPVGVGKTQLALAVTKEMNVPIFRVDGDSRYSEQKLAGWFDPPAVIQKGFTAAAFMEGPLVEAMRKGGVLFINELNRLPEGVQNILLPAIDERMIIIPRLGEIRAADGFLVIATQNPKEFVATSHLSEAILDRFELVTLDYQSEADEIKIVSQQLSRETLAAELTRLVVASVHLVRATRVDPRIRRGASIRAAIAIAKIARVLMEDGLSFDPAFAKAALLALPTRIEMERENSESSAHAEITALLSQMAQEALKKKPLT
ncbi:MoxR family ATPase [Bdellovibrionota bacterium FG-1]